MVGTARAYCKFRTDINYNTGLVLVCIKNTGDFAVRNPYQMTRERRRVHDVWCRLVALSRYHGTYTVNFASIMLKIIPVAIEG